MTPTELNQTSQFGFLNIWGINATCVNATTGSTFPATCPPDDSHCNCKTTAATLENQLFLPVMETSLHAQSRALKAFKAPTFLPVLGYLNSAVMQQWSVGQNQINTNESFAPWLMSIGTKGVIDCFADGCDYQGMEYRVIDFRLPEARAWWVQNILGGLIDSPDIDGTFLDEANQFVSVLCPRWGCTPDELTAITAGQLAQLDDALAYAASLEKWMCISLTCTFDSLSSYCDAAHASMATHGHALRFYEFFGTEHLEYLTYEAQTLGLPIVAHAGGRTMNPDWVELAVFLIGAGEYSYFSFSHSWNFDSFVWQPEYDLQLGNPLSPAMAVNVSTHIDPWSAQVGTNVIFSMINSPGTNGPNVKFLGNATSASACETLANPPSGAYVAWTWISSTGGSYALGCYGRTDDGKGDFTAACFPSSTPAPCHVALQAGCTSAVSFAISTNVTTWTRQFEFLDVTYHPSNGSAYITPRQ